MHNSSDQQIRHNWRWTYNLKPDAISSGFWSPLIMWNVWVLSEHFLVENVIYSEKWKGIIISFLLVLKHGKEGFVMTHFCCISCSFNASWNATLPFVSLWHSERIGKEEWWNWIWGWMESEIRVLSFRSVMNQLYFVFFYIQLYFVFFTSSWLSWRIRQVFWSLKFFNDGISVNHFIVFLFNCFPVEKNIS